jgi:hypothetical protein
LEGICPLVANKPGGLVIEAEHPQQIAGGAEQVDRDDADGATGPGR